MVHAGSSICNIVSLITSYIIEPCCAQSENYWHQRKLIKSRRSGVKSCAVEDESGLWSVLHISRKRMEWDKNAKTEELKRIQIQIDINLLDYFRHFASIASFNFAH